MFRKTIEHVVGFLVVVSTLIGGIIACGWYVMSNDERQKGALALAIGLVLVVVVWFWVTKDRKLRQLDD